MSRFNSIKQNGIVLMLVASFLFSVMGALAKFSMERLPHAQVVFFRAFTCLPFLALYLWKNQISFFGGKKFGLLFVRSAAGFTSLMLTFYTTKLTDLGTAAALQQSAILFVAFLSVLFLGEKVSRTLVFFMLVSVGGAILILKPGVDLNVAALTGLCGGFFAAVAYVSIKKLHASESFVTMVFNFMFFTSLLSAVLFGYQFIWPTSWEWGALLLLGLSGTIAQLFMTYSYKLADASIVSPYSLAAVLFSALWGIFFWGEIPDLWSILGAILIIGSGIGILKSKKAASPLTGDSDI